MMQPILRSNQLTFDNSAVAMARRGDFVQQLRQG